QQLTKSVAGAHHPHLQRRNTDSRELRHFIVAHVFDVLQQKRFSLLGTQMLQGAIDFFTPRSALRRVILRRLENSGLVDDERLRPAPPSRSQRSAAIDENTEQPCAEALRILTPRQR